MLDLDLSGYSFECVALLPKQFFADRRQLGEPIERLMFAVLNDAIRCYQTNVGVRRPHAQRLLAETKEWSAGRRNSSASGASGGCLSSCIDLRALDALQYALRRQRNLSSRP